MRPIERVAFFGSPEFAVPTLRELSRSRFGPQLVVSQPGRRAGRGRRVQEPPVAEWALAHGVELWQPERVRDPEFLRRFAERAFDVAVVVAFGQIFPRRLLELPRLGCVNLHASLLPRHRGAAPIQAAIAAGDAETGVTTMRMDVGLDTGPVLLQRTTPIAADETSAALALRLAAMGGELMVRTLEGLEREDLEPAPQDDAAATSAPRLGKSDGRVDWHQPATVIERRCRAFDPWPGSVAGCRGRHLKLIELRLVAQGAGGAEPGTYLGLRDECVVVACGSDSALGLVRVQRPGRRVITAADFARGEHLVEGAVEFSEPMALDPP